MESLDISTVSEDEWNDIIRRKRLCLGIWTDPNVLKPELCKEDTFSPMLWAWFIRRMLENNREDLFRWYAEHCQSFRVFLESVGSHDGVFWDNSVPKRYRYKTSSWLSNWFFGASLWVRFAKDMLQLQYWCCVFWLEDAGIDDLYRVWEAYEGFKSRLEKLIDTLLAESWFWHLTLRRCLKEIKRAIEKRHKKLLEKVGNRFMPVENSLDIANMLVDSGFYQGLFKQLYKAQALEILLAEWQFHYPEWLVLYQARLGVEGIDIEGFSEVYLKRRLQDAEESPYRYGCIIERILSYDEQQIASLLRATFPKTMSLYPYFWYQFREMANHYGKSCHQNITVLIERWVYQSSGQLETMEDVDISKIPLENQTWLIGRYYECLHAPLVEAYTQTLRKVWHQIFIPLTYQSQRGAQILWQSMRIVLVLDVYDGYVQRLQSCLATHQYLSGSVAPQLQAYMITVAKYTWIAHWPDQVEELVDALQPVESQVWQRGLMVLKKAIEKNVEKRSVYDLS